MLWLCLHFPQLPLSALGAEKSDAVVVDQHGSQRWLITGTPELAAGTPLSGALALQPELKVRVRRPASEHAALRSLACWIYRFGQPVAADIQDLSEPGRLPRALLWVELGSSLALFGSFENLRDRLCGELMELGHAAQIGCAPTRAGAALLACAGRFDPVHDAQALSRSLEPLPLAWLLWPGELLQALRGVGFRTLGDLFAVPRQAFSKRFGPQYRLALDRLLGLAPDAFEAIVPPDTFRRRFELSAEVEDIERLQFPLKRLCTELQAYLRARDRGLRSVTLAVTHAGARQTCIHAQFVDPHRDATRIFDALRERLERDGLPLPARELLLMAEDFSEARLPRTDLFDGSAGQAQRWSAAVERIRARLGEEKVWTPQALEDHRPECAMRRIAAQEAAAAYAVPSFARPAFLLPQPWPMPAPQLPEDFGRERIESGWWDGQEVRRDYTTLDINGARAWVYRDLVTRTWHLHGWFS
jgi:protein ImuB